MTLEPGQTLDGYRLVRPIGRGSFSTVWRAEHDGLDSAVAIKVLAENWSLDPDVRVRFVTEGQLVRRAASPAVIAVHDVGETESGQPYLVFELADRGDLARRLERLGGEVQADDLRRVVDALADGLGSLHANGIVHRDVKPANLLVVGSGNRPPPGRLLGDGERLVLGDLGVAKDLAMASGLTTTAGTASYRAPEQAEAGGLVDERADVHAASAVIAELVTGGRHDAAVGWVDALAASSAADDELAAVLERGLAVDPLDRPSSIEEWRTELVAALRREGDGGRQHSSSRRLLAAIGFIGALVGLAVGATVVFLIDDDPDPGRVAIVTQADGRLVATGERDGITVFLIGPADLSVGAPGTYFARSEPNVPLVWLTPDGPLDGAEPLVVTATEPGRYRVQILAVPEAVRSLRVDLVTPVLP